MSLSVHVLSVGDELLAGDILDTNAHWLANELTRRGHRLREVLCVGDTVEAVRSAVERSRLASAEGACDLLVVTGGLGPTRDDLTRDGVAAAFGRALHEHADLLAHVQGSNRRLTSDARRQAEMPAGARVLDNPRGTAPGFLLREDGLAVACLPGVPSELRPMVRAVLDELAATGDGVPARRLLSCGLTESDVGERLADLMDARAAGCRVGITASLGILTVSVRGEDADAVDRVHAAARERLGASVFGEGGESLVGVVVRALVERGATISCAESCTGGLLAGAITSVPGSSAVLQESFVTYANAAKTKRLGVPEDVLAEHGAVSEVVARAMAEGARLRADADVAVSITGIAGPDGGTPEKPVGTVWFGLADGEGTLTRHVAWRGGRAEIRERAVNVALDMVRRRLATS